LLKFWVFVGDKIFAQGEYSQYDILGLADQIPIRFSLSRGVQRVTTPLFECLSESWQAHCLEKTEYANVLHEKAYAKTRFVSLDAPCTDSVILVGDQEELFPRNFTNELLHVRR